MIDAREHATMWDEGTRRLDEKIQTIQRNPGITFSDFGSRRRWSRTWQERVVSRLAEEIPGQFRGTSNSYLSMKYNLTPMGANAHELPMVYSAIYRDEDERAQRLVSSQRVLEDWEAEYGLDLSIFLPDTGKRVLLFPRRFETHARNVEGVAPRFRTAERVWRSPD